MTLAELSPARLLLNPWVLGGMALTWINDHYLKAEYGNWVTGKLSDFAGLAFFPFWVLGALEVAASLLRRPWRAGPWHAAWVAGAVGILFTAIKMVPEAAAGYCAGMGWIRAITTGRDPKTVVVHLTRDPTDLVALPALALCYIRLRREARTAKSR